MKYLLKTLKIIAALYLVLALFVIFGLEKMMFYPHPTRASEPLKKEMFFLPSPVGNIACLYLKTDGATKTVIYSHGNAEDIADRVPQMKYLTALGLSVLAYDYPGYGLSEGFPTEAGVYASADAAYKYLTEKCELDPKNIIIYGRSIGSGPSHYLAEKYPVGGLIVECGFTSITRTVTRVRLFPLEAFPNINRVANIHCPVLYMHGTKDNVVPFSHAEKMVALANEPKSKLFLEGCNHVSIPEFAGEKYKTTITDFIQTLE